MHRKMTIIVKTIQITMKPDSIALTIFCISMLPLLLIYGGRDHPMEKPEPIEIEQERQRK